MQTMQVVPFNETAKNDVTYVTLRQNHPTTERIIRTEVERMTLALNGLEKYQIVTPEGKKKTLMRTVPKPDEITATQFAVRLGQLMMTGNDPSNWVAPVRLEITEKMTNGQLRDAILKFLTMGSIGKQSGFQIASSVNFARRVVLEVNGKFVSLGRLAQGTNWPAVRSAVERAVAGTIKTIDVGTLEGLAELSTGIKPAEGLSKDDLEEQVIATLQAAAERKRELAKARAEAKKAADKAAEATEK